MPVQNPPPSPADLDIGLVAELIILAKTFRQLTNLKLAKIGLMSGQDELLLVLSESRSVTVGQIAKAIKIRPSTATKIIDLLKKRGWVIRESKDGDARLVFVRLTPAGAVKRDEVESVRATLDRELSKFLPKKLRPFLEGLDHTLRERVSASQAKPPRRAQDRTGRADLHRTDTAQTRNPAADRRGT